MVVHYHGAKLNVAPGQTIREAMGWQADSSKPKQLASPAVDTAAEAKRRELQDANAAELKALREDTAELLKLADKQAPKDLAAKPGVADAPTGNEPFRVFGKPTGNRRAAEAPTGPIKNEDDAEEARAFKIEQRARRLRPDAKGMSSRLRFGSGSFNAFAGAHKQRPE